MKIHTERSLIFNNSINAFQKMCALDIPRVLLSEHHLPGPFLPYAWLCPLCVCEGGGVCEKDERWGTSNSFTIRPSKETSKKATKRPFRFFIVYRTKQMKHLQWKILKYQCHQTNFTITKSKTDKNRQHVQGIRGPEVISQSPSHPSLQFWKIE